MLAAAEELVRNETEGTKRFAEAVLRATPKPSMVAVLAVDMETAGAVTPRGEPYSRDALLDARVLAMNWIGKWHPEAAARTHLEAGRPDSANGLVLDALCAVARGEHRERPDACTPENWAAACLDARRAAEKGRRWPVSANMLRTALGRKPNLPTRDKPLEELPLAEQVEAMAGVLASNPKVALALVSDVNAMTAITKAEMHKARDESDRLGPERPRKATGPAWVASRLVAARREIGDAVDAVLDIGGYAAGVPDIVAVALAQLHRAVAAIDGAVEGSAVVTDEELAELFGSC